MEMSELINMTKEQLDDTVKNMLGGIVDSAVAKALEALNKGKEHQQVEEPPLEKLGEIVRGRKFTIREDQKGIAAARMVRALAAGRGSLDRAKHFMKKVYDDALGDEVQRALVASDLESGGALVIPEYAAELIELLRSKTVVRAAGARTLPMNNGTLTIRKHTAGSSAGYVGESRNISVTQPETGQIELTSKKLAAIVPISNDLLTFTSGPSADEFVRDDLVLEMSVREDRAFLRDDGSQHTPRGMRYWAAAANVTASNGTTTADIEQDFKDLLNALEGNDVRLIRPAWFMNPTRKNGLSVLRHSGGGQLIFPDLKGANPNIWGYPVFTTTSLPNNLNGDETEVMFADMADAIIGEVSSMQIVADPSAAYVDGGEMKSAFSMDETLIRAITRHDFAFRHRESVAVKTGVAWG
jgi:HK97 family phage major capsid protein